MTIVESSSGNTAIALAALGKERGYRVVAVCDRHLPAAKRARLRAVGASIVFLPETPVGRLLVLVVFPVDTHDYRRAASPGPERQLRPKLRPNGRIPVTERS